IVRGKLSADDLERLSDQTENWAGRFTDEKREAPIILVADTLTNAGRNPSAVAILARLAERAPTANVLTHLGDAEAAAGKYAHAAAADGRAWELDRSAAVPLFLEGWATQKSGDVAGGKKLLALADIIPLANVSPRHE